MVDLSARGRARADAQGRRDDGAGSEESIGNRPSDAGGRAVIRGFWFSRESHPFFGEVSEEQRPWAIKGEDRRARTARRTESIFQKASLERGDRSGARAAFHTGRLLWRSKPSIQELRCRRAWLFFTAGCGVIGTLPALRAGVAVSHWR